MKPDLLYQIESLLETYQGYFSDEVNKEAHNKIVAEDIIRVIKKNFMNENNLVVQMIGDLKQDNTSAHKDIKDRLDKVNNSIACIKKRQLILRGVLIGAIGVLVILGFMPARVYELLTRIF